MDAEQKELAEKIVEALLALPWEKRADVISSVRFNGIFCSECGIGSREHPNPHCQCTNDE